MEVDPQRGAAFWKQELSKSELRQFPTLPSPIYEPQANGDLEHFIALDWPRTEMTPSTIIRSAWAVLATAYTSSSDVVFGASVSGRQADLKGLSNCVAPTISTVPIAVTINWDETIRELQARIQRQALNMTSYEQYGLQNIQNTCVDAKSGLFQTLLVVQPVAQGKSLHEDSLLFKARSFTSNINTRGTDPFNIYALMLICELTQSGLLLKMSFDDRIVERTQIHRIACQFENILRQMCTENTETTKVDDVQIASETDVESFLSQNAKPPEEPTTCVQDSITSVASKQPDAVAVDAWDGQLSYCQVDELSNILCQKLIGLGIIQGSVIALCLAKSKWTPIAQLAVFKAGGVCLLQSVDVPEQRLGVVFGTVNIHLAMASESHLDMVSKYLRCFTIKQLLGKPDQPCMCVDLPILHMSDPAALLVSSGSTGEPKRILWSHRALAANVQGLTNAVLLNEASRVFQFTSHDFDVCTVEMVATFVNGSRLCIPSESERLDGIAGAVNSSGCNYACLTPSTAKLLRPEEVPCLKTIVFAGEKLVQDEVDRWKEKCRILNWYGPCECSAAAFSAADDDAWRNGVIGRSNSSTSTLCWLVDQRNYNKLVPFGAIGEIALEGPACADQYLGNSLLTEQSFRGRPSFLSRTQAARTATAQGVIYLTGDLARYDSNGNIEFIGRKDTLFKLRGNLITPEVVEHHIRQRLTNKNITEVVTEVIIPKHGSDALLVAFLCFPEAEKVSRDDLEKMTAGLNEELNVVLPQSSIPAFYLPIQNIPMTSTGKIDRRRLREMGASLQAPRKSYGKRQEPATIAERTLREMWSLVLQIDAEKIFANDSFLQVGDSI